MSLKKGQRPKRNRQEGRVVITLSDTAWQRHRAKAIQAQQAEEKNAQETSESFWWQGSITPRRARLVDLQIRLGQLICSVDELTGLIAGIEEQIKIDEGNGG